MSSVEISRLEGEKITLRVQPGTDADDLLAQLLLDGITIDVLETSGTRARIGIEAPQDLQILRAELEEV